MSLHTHPVYFQTRTTKKVSQPHQMSFAKNILAKVNTLSLRYFRTVKYIHSALSQTQRSHIVTQTGITPNPVCNCNLTPTLASLCVAARLGWGYDRKCQNVQCLCILGSGCTYKEYIEFDNHNWIWKKAQTEFNVKNFKKVYSKSNELNFRLNKFLSHRGKYLVLPHCSKSEDMYR